MKAQRSHATQSGQTLLLVLIAALALLAAILWLADLHHVIRGKDKTQDAGDAAALEAARWQGATLNLEGELNLLHLLALSTGDDAAVSAITGAQSRVLFAGPLTGVAAAQQAAKLNGAPVNEEFTSLVREHARLVRSGYAGMVGGEMAKPEPWEGAWSEYASMLDALADDGIAAGVDNAAFYSDRSGAHILLSPGFYYAVRGRDWCWFRNAAPGLLDAYSGPQYWPPLPEASEEPEEASEFLSVWVGPTWLRAQVVENDPFFRESLDAAGLADYAETSPTGSLSHTWIVYRRNRWGAWDVMKDPSFPVEGKLRPEYDYSGADAAIRVETEVARLSSPDSSPAAIQWTAAAKPFGYLTGGAGKEPPSASPLVLPVFRDVRLIALDASSAPEGGAFDLKWRKHCVEHLPSYLAAGVSALHPGCWRCDALRRWEDPQFRRSGSQWLSTNAWKCVISPGGTSPGGGSRHAH